VNQVDEGVEDDDEEGPVERQRDQGREVELRD